MKKIYIVMAVLATATMISCEREKSFNEEKLGENDIAFVLQGVSTRSTENAPEVIKGESFQIGDENSGDVLFLEESIEELNPSPATRGIPAYTANVGNLYKQMGVYTEKLGEVAFEVMDMYDHKGTPSDSNAPTSAGPDNKAGDGWRYHGNFTESPWSDITTPVDFYFNMPVAPANVTFKNRENKQIKFSYTSPSTGKGQEDILFSQASYSKNTHDGYLPNGAPVLMYHALTGVKFRVGNDNSGTTKTIITSVKLSGLKNKGDCVVDLSATEIVKWTPETSTGTFTQSFENPDYDKNKGKNNIDGTISTEGSDSDHTWNSELSGTSWTVAAANNNLNAADGSLTFWFIPQAITESVQLEITFCIKTPDTSGEFGGGEITHTITNFGSILAGKNTVWKAGQLRTYTLEPKEVDVEIFDEMDGAIKKNLHVTNTGNVEEYVRMMVMGNWCDESGNIVVGYKYQNKDDEFEEGEDYNTMVNPWFRGGYENPETHQMEDPYGDFDSTFKLGVPQGDWKLGSGSYFYYTKPIGAGVQLDSQTQSLFKQYKLTNVPNIYISSSNGGRVKANIHLELEVVIQAIGTKDASGTPYEDCWDAWTKATGTTIEQK